MAENTAYILFKKAHDVSLSFKGSRKRNETIEAVYPFDL
jgi:hypothetical protein